MDRPRPVPSVFAAAAVRLRSNGWNTRSSASGAIPTPVSAISTWTAPADPARIEIVTSPPRSVNFTALEIRFSSIWRSARGSALTIASPTVRSRATLIPYPVRTTELDARHWWRSETGARRMIVEYDKYLAILFREGLISLGGKARQPVSQSHADAAADSGAPA